MSIIDMYKQKTGQEFAKQTIEAYMKKEGIESVDELLAKSPSVHQFDRNLLGIIRTHGYFIMDDNAYKEILETIKQEQAEKSKLDTSKLETTTINGHKYASLYDEEAREMRTVETGQQTRDITDQMRDVQKEHRQFQKNGNQNSLDVFKYMQDNIKITPDQQSTSNLDISKQNGEEQEIARVAKAFEEQIGHPVDIDLNRKIIYDNSVVYSIEKRDGLYQVISQDTNQAVQEKAKSKQLVKKNINPPKAA